MGSKRIVPSYGQVGDEIVNQTDPQFGDATDAQSADPLDALHTLLTDGAEYKPTPNFSDGTSRNEALSEALGRRYGVDSSAPQVDLESLDKFFRGADVQDALAKTLPIEQAKDQALASQEGLRARSALDIANTNGHYRLQEQAMKDAAAGAKAAPSLDPATIDYLATQSGRDASTLTKIPTNLRGPVLQRMADQGIDVNQLTNQTRQMSEAANDLLPMIDDIQNQAVNLQQKGQFGLIDSPLRQFFVNHGAGTLMGYGADAASNMGKFQTTLGLLQSGIARAHAGARGAGNTQMAERFEKLANASGDLPTFLGELQGVRDLLSRYAEHTNPGVTANDPYANPDYQPK